MTAFTLGEAAATALARVTARGRRCSGASAQVTTPVRRGSAEAGSFEDLFYATPAKGECDRMVRAARDALDTGRRLRRDARATGRPLEGNQRTIAALTAGAVRVFEELCALARVNNGRVYPSYDRLAAATALGRATVARALDLLEAAGFLLRRRRFKRVEGEGAGPRYAQTSNAYRPMLPVMLARLLPHWRRPAPVPVDATQHAITEHEQTAAMRAQLSCRDMACATADGALGQALALLGAMLDTSDAGTRERESHSRPEHKLNLLNNRVATLNSGNTMVTGQLIAVGIQQTNRNPRQTAAEPRRPCRDISGNPLYRHVASSACRHVV